MACRYVYRLMVDLPELYTNTFFLYPESDSFPKIIEKAAKSIARKSGEKPTIKRLNDFFREHAQWKNVAGIMMYDQPINDDYVMVKGFYYKKRIQLAVYDLDIVKDFNLKSTNS